MEINLLIKLLFSHLLSDFLLQPSAWVKDKNEKHFASTRLYLHTAVTGLSAWIFMGFHYWQTALLIFITHTLIDGWKTYHPEKVSYFLIDQLLHLFVIVICWSYISTDLSQLKLTWVSINSNNNIWVTATAFFFLIWPSAIIIGQLTKKWRVQLADADTLGDAGKWIGIIERILIMIFVLKGHYDAIGLLVAAKSILRFNENNRPEIKTEYLLIGTLISMSLAIVTGLCVLSLTSGTG